MADDSTINIEFTSDTTGFQAGADQVQVAITNVNKTIADTGNSAQDATPKAGALFTTLEKSSDAAVKGILTGTENWHQAMLKVITDLEVKLAQMSLNDVMDWTRKQADKLASTVSTNAATIAANDAKNTAVTASDTAAAKTSAGATASQLIKQIGADAATAYSGVYANLSPVLGPAAAIPAGIAYASVAAMEGLVSLDVGAWNLGSDMVAQLHQGEMVVPQTFAQGIRDGSGLGGSSNVLGDPFLSAIRQGVFDGAELTLYRAFMPTYGNVAAGTVIMFAGRVAEIDASGSLATFSVNSHLELLNQNLPRNLYQSSCLNALYDTACTLNSANFLVTASAGASSTASLVNTSLTQATGYFDLGVLTFTSGENNRISRTIKTYLQASPSTVSLIAPFPTAPNAGDTFTIIPGCDKQQSTCQNKFNNLTNFRGFPYVPENSTAA